MCQADKLASDLDEARARLRLLKENLPKEVSIAAIGVTEKLPWKILTLREAVIWRVEELGRASVSCIENRDAVATTVLVRALLETVALLSELHSLFDAGRIGPQDELAEKIDRMLLGSYKDSQLPNPVKVTKFISALDKKYPGVSNLYGSMSEVAHPNFRGVHGSYAEIDRERFRTSYGRDGRTLQRTLESSANVLIACLATAEHSYNAIADTFPEFLSQFTPI